MPAIEIGRICVKKLGREEGKKCIIVDVIDKNYVLITGPKAISKIKRRRANVDHILPTNEKIQIKRGASDEDITEALKNTNKIEEMKVSMDITLS